MSYTELGVGASRAMVQMRTVADRQCAAGAVLAFDVDDRYAFDIDEPVSVTLTYAPEYSKPFTIYWDANGGEGLGRAARRDRTGRAASTGHAQARSCAGSPGRAPAPSISP